MNFITKSLSKSAQAANLIKAEIDSQGLVPGQRLAAAREFADKLGVSKQVIQSAYALLEKEGIIETRPRSGAFVAEGARRKLQEGSEGEYLGMVMHSECGSYGMATVKAIHDYAAEHSIKIVTISAMDFGEAAIESAQELAGAGCTAIMIPWVPTNCSGEIANFIEKCKLPVSVPLYIQGFEKNSVKLPEMVLRNRGKDRRTGDMQLAEDLCEYFTRCGEKHIVLLGTDDQYSYSMQDKISGYTKYMEENGLDKHIELVGPTVKGMDKAAARIANLQGQTAIIAFSDTYAVRFMTAMHKLGFCAPHDYKIIGDDNSEDAKYCDPPLSSARANFYIIGSEIVKCALALSQGQEWHSSWIGPKEIVVRSSCGGMFPQALGVLKDMQACGVKICFDDVPALVD